ncbi:fluoride efflux transporter FluC [Planctomycetaceae bacterium SH139]
MTPARPSSQFAFTCCPLLAMVGRPILWELVGVACGGAVGSLLRYGLTRLAVWLPGSSSYLGTFAANLIGCLAIGVLTGYLSSGGKLAAHQQVAIKVGLLGGLTTFSTLALESVALAADQRWMLSALCLSANLVFGCLAVVVGIALGKSLNPAG